MATQTEKTKQETTKKDNKDDAKETMEECPISKASFGGSISSSLTKTQVLVTLIVIIIVTLALSAYIGLSGMSSQWYKELEKPSSLSLTSSGIFWVLAFALYGIATYMAYSCANNDREKSNILVIGILLPFLTFIWFVAFFALHWPALSFVVLMILILTLFIGMVVYFKQKRMAGWILFLHILWISYVAFLTYEIIILNM